MADLLIVTGGVVGSKVIPEIWAAAPSIFTSEDRNDGSAYGFTSATSLVTLPASGLADGYLFVGAFEFEDSSNGRFNPQGKFVQVSGTGDFVGGPTGGYNRDNSEDRSYVRAWAFVNNPSASSTYQFQWKSDTDDAGVTDGTVRSTLQVIPLYYNDAAFYTSSSAALYGGTTPNKVTGFSGTDGNDISISSDVVTLGAEADYLILGSQFFEGRGGRTQRWHGLGIDGSWVDYFSAYSYYRSTAVDETGEMFAGLVTSDGTKTVQQMCYRGAGVSAGQGGADFDGSTPVVGDHALVILELHADCESFIGIGPGTTEQNIATTGPVDINALEATTADADSWVKDSDAGVEAQVAMDALILFNVAAASETVASGARYTAFAEVTKNGTEDGDSFAGDFERGNQTSQDTFGWSANSAHALALAENDVVGVSVTELVGSEGGGGALNVQLNWASIMGINLDTMKPSGEPEPEPEFRPSIIVVS